MTVTSNDVRIGQGLDNIPERGILGGGLSYMSIYIYIYIYIYAKLASVPILLQKHIRKTMVCDAKA